MRYLLPTLAAGLLLAGSAAYANEAGPDHEKNEQEHLQMMKQEMLKDLDVQIGLLQKFRDCIGAAADHPAIKKCHEEKEAAMKALFASKKQERLRRIEERQQELEKEKQKLQQQESKP